MHLLFPPPQIPQPILFQRRVQLVHFAVKYEIGVRLILKELGTRLRVVRDVESAEILSTLLGKKFGLVDEFVDPVVEVMHEKFHM